MGLSYRYKPMGIISEGVYMHGLRVNTSTIKEDRTTVGSVMVGYTIFFISNIISNFRGLSSRHCR